MLVDDYGISIEKIIPFWVYARRELWRIKTENYDLKNIRGLIFGNSHAAHGFLEEELFAPFMNLAVSSQDLYYSYRTFCEVMRNHGDALENLEYVIIDLYDYIDFNIDLLK